MLLAIDTSNEYAGVALWDAGGLRAEATWFAGRHHTEQLAPQIDLLTQHLGRGPRDLTVIAIATGPGSWTGLRAGMSLGKALAISLNIPVVGIPTVDALAYSQRGRPGQVVTIIRLGRDRFGIAAYELGDHAVRRTVEIASLPLDAALHVVPDALLVGDVPTAAREAGMRSAPLADLQRRAAYLAELGWERHMRADYDDLVTLEPMYLGDPVR